MTGFEELLGESINAVERFVKFKISNYADAEDVLQDVLITAYQSFDRLESKASFKPWIIGIARNKCADYYRKKAKQTEISIELLSESALTVGNRGISVHTVVSDTIEKLGARDKQILYLYYFKELPQDEIALRLGIPLGTVKSRLYTAKKNFRANYPSIRTDKGEHDMKKMPDIIPEYKIVQTDKEPFSVKWEEVMGWFIVPKLGEKLSWAMYDFPEKKRTETCHIEVIGRAEVHGIEGVEIVSVEEDPMECNSAGGQSKVERRFVAQLTDTHCRILAESHFEDGVKRCYTFLDGDSFLNNWGFGENNCGNEVALCAKGEVIREGNIITAPVKEFLLDVVGRYNVTINGKTYDTVCMMDCDTYIEGAVTEQYLDKNGRTILWRRFNRNDWASNRYGKLWTDMLPENERLTVNGETYVHWYDCVTDYIF